MKSPKVKNAAQAERKTGAPIQSRAERESELAEWRCLRDAYREQCLSGRDVSAVEHKISETVQLLQGLDSDIERLAQVGEESIERKARRTAAMEARTQLSVLSESAIAGLLQVIEHGNGEEAKYATGALVDGLVKAINEMKRLYGDANKRRLFQEEAESKIEFPGLVSIFKKENLDLERFISHELRLGAALPILVDARKPYSAYATLAIQLVIYIDYIRCFCWKKSEWVSEDSVYSKVVPDLDTKDFCDTNIVIWDKVLAFHLDFFQAPKHTQKRVAWDHGLEAEYAEKEAENARHVIEKKDADGNLIMWSRPGWFSALCPWAEITTIPEFREILLSGKDSNVQSESQLYNRVKNKVLLAARNLVPKQP